MAITKPPGQRPSCLPTIQIVRYYLETCAGRRCPPLERHLAGCRRCQAKLQALDLASRPGALTTGTPSG